MIKRIKAAAIRLENGVVLALPKPHRHHDIICHLHAFKEPMSGATQGFITEQDDFVDRDEAFQIAMSAGQILPKEQYSGRPNQLYTEDMW